jgi:hypothetical protein
MNDPLAQELLSLPLARLAYTGPDGFPRVIPIGFYWDGQHIVVCTAPTSPKVRALAANPKVALTIDIGTAPAKALMVRGTAHSELVDGVPLEYLEASRKGIGPELWSGFEAQVRGLYKQMVRIAIVPEWATVFDFGTGRIPGFLLQLASHRNS